METLEGAQRVLVTRHLVEPGAADVFENLPREFRETVSEVHYADGGSPENAGRQGTYGIDVDAEWLAKILGTDGNRRPSNLISVVRLKDHGLGDHAPDYLAGLSAQDLADVSDGAIDGEEEALAELVGGVDFPEIVNADSGTMLERFYRTGPALDQGSEGACTGFTGANFVNCGPRVKTPPLTNADGFAIYDWNRKNDEWPGEDYDGSSVVATCKWLVANGYVEKFVQTASFEDMCRWKLAGPREGQGGTLMLSTPWYEGMYVTDAQGFIRPTGRKVGGHAILDRGITRFRGGSLFNSWGESYGVGGVGVLAEKDYRWLVKRGLRAFCAVQLPGTS